MPCDVKLPDMCEKIDELPGVSNAFKQCMQGRCGCGGSHHKRLKISCADKNDCGPCGSSRGCSLGGSQMWYCDPTTDECNCIETVFHEMSHACGAMHSLEYWIEQSCDVNDDPCRIGRWFQSECGSTGSFHGNVPGWVRE